MPATSFYLPTKTPANCAVCNAINSKYYPLTLCPACSTAAHCTKKCREKDPEHNSKVCIQRAHLNLAQVYPSIAWAAELTRLRHVDLQPALRHEIVEVPDREVTGQPSTPGGTLTCVIRFGRPMEDVPALSPRDPNYGDRLVRRPESPPNSPPALARWFSFCYSLNERAYLRRRISRDGHLLPVVMGMGIAILLELFSVTREFPIAPCLNYLGKPIRDFGICRGAVSVKPERVMSYVRDGSDEPPFQLQQPENHFWLYFVTEDSEETLYLDVGLFVYGDRHHVLDSDMYLPRGDHKDVMTMLQELLEIPSDLSEFLDPHAAAHFSTQNQRDEMALKAIQTHYETDSISLLRNSNLTTALENGALRNWEDESDAICPWHFTEEAVRALGEYMKEIDQLTGLGSPTLGDSDVEMMFLMDTINNGTRILRNVLDEETWNKMPKSPCVERCKWELGINPRQSDA